MSSSNERKTTNTEEDDTESDEEELSPEEEVLRSMEIVEEEIDSRISLLELQTTQYEKVLRYIRYINNKGKEEKMKETQHAEEKDSLKSRSQTAQKAQQASRGYSTLARRVAKEESSKGGLRDSKTILSSSLQSLSEEEEEKVPEVRRSLEKIEREAQDSLPSYLDDLLSVARKARAAPAPSSSSKAMDERKAKIKNTCVPERERKSSAIGVNRKPSIGRQTMSSRMNKNVSVTNDKGRKIDMNSRSKISTYAQPKSSSSSSSLKNDKKRLEKEVETNTDEQIPETPTHRELVRDFAYQLRIIEKFKKSETYLNYCVVNKETLLAQSKFLTLLLNGFETEDIANYNDEDEDDIDVDAIIAGKEKEKKRKRLTLINTSMDWLYKSLEDELTIMHAYLEYETQPGDTYPFEKAIRGADELKRLLLVCREEYERVLKK